MKVADEIKIDGHVVKSVELWRKEVEVPPTWGRVSKFREYKLGDTVYVKALVPFDSPVRLMKIGQEVEVTCSRYMVRGVVSDIEAV